MFQGMTALHWGCSKGHLDAVKLLIEYQAFPNHMEMTEDRLVQHSQRKFKKISLHLTVKKKKKKKKDRLSKTEIKNEFDQLLWPHG